jgi:hypothetical protein
LFVGDDITLYGKYELGGKDVVLVGDHGSLSLVVLEPGEKPRRLSDERFFSRAHAREMVLEDGRLEIDLGSDGGRHKLARFDGERLLFVFEVAGSPAWVEESGMIATRAGTLTVVAEREAPRHAVKIGKTTVFEGDYVTLYGKYPLGAQDVVLIGDNCGGTACWAGDRLSLLVLEPGEKPRTLSDERFFGGGSGAALEDGRLKIDLGWDRGKRKLAWYDGNDLSIVLEDRGRPPLSEEECKGAYDGMELCVSGRYDDARCKDPEAGFYGAAWRALFPILQLPGFRADGFTRACVVACKDGKAPPLDARFRKSVCGIARSAPRTSG